MPEFLFLINLQASGNLIVHCSDMNFCEYHCEKYCNFVERHSLHIVLSDSRNHAFPKNWHTEKSGEMTMLFAVYVIAVVKVKGLSNNYIIRSFDALIQRKIKKHVENKKKFELPHSPEELMGMLDRGPLSEIYNAIYYSVKGHFKLNRYGYAKICATKICAMACDWENLLTPGRNGKQLIHGLKTHRFTGRKDVIQMLHKLNVNTCIWICRSFI